MSQGCACRWSQVPLATYTGWNLRGRGHGEGAMHEFSGSTIPLPDTESVRAATGDPRPSIEQRYGDAEGYVAAIVEAAERLVADGLMLEEDIARVAERARDWSRPLHDVRPLNPRSHAGGLPRSSHYRPGLDRASTFCPCRSVPRCPVYWRGLTAPRNHEVRSRIVGIPVYRDGTIGGAGGQ